MITRYQKIVYPSGPGKEKTAEPQAGAESADACRCKEVSEMRPRRLFGLMLSDLAFWKKKEEGLIPGSGKKNKPGTKG